MLKLIESLLIKVGLEVIVKYLKSCKIFFRIWKSFASPKIAILAQEPMLGNIKSFLCGSNIFNEDAILTGTDIGSLQRFNKERTVFIVHFKSFYNANPSIKDEDQEISKIVGKVEDNSKALLIYAPKAEGNIPENMANIIDQKWNVSVVNFRGRLINDIFAFLITTNIEK